MDILDSLEKEAGLTRDQSLRALEVIKKFLDEENVHVDWKRFFKGKYEDLKDSLSSFFGKISSKVENTTDKITDKIQDYSTNLKDREK